MQVLRITGGLSAEPMHATAGGEHLARSRGEGLEAFEARAVAAGEASGAGVVVIGGLPDSEDAAGAEAEADALAEIIMTVADPDPHHCAALADLVGFAQRTGLFTPSPRHLAALELARSVAEADGGGKDLFVHVNTLKMSNIATLAPGDRVEYEKVADNRGFQAHRVQLV